MFGAIIRQAISSKFARAGRLRRLLISTSLMRYIKLLVLIIFVAGLLLLQILRSQLLRRKTKVEELALYGNYIGRKFHSNTNNVSELITIINDLQANGMPMHYDESKTNTSLVSGVSSYPIALHKWISQYIPATHCYIHRFRTSYHREAVNVVGVVKSSRADNRDTFVVVIGADWHTGHGAKISAMGVMLAGYLQNVDWMSRDIVFLFVDTSLPFAAGVRGFLKHYNSGNGGVWGSRYGLNDEHGMIWIKGRVPIRQSIIRLALAIKMSSDYTPHPYLSIEGTDGRLPNQDLVNVFIRNSKQSPLCGVRTLWGSVLRLATNDASETLHNVFLQRAIPSLTIDTTSSDTPTELRELSGWIDQTLHGLTFIEANLHHSFNFYFFINKVRHISNGIYMYFIIPLILPLIVWPVSHRYVITHVDVIRGVLGLLLILTVGSLPSYLLLSKVDVSTAINYTSELQKLPIWYSIPKPSIIPDCSAILLEEEVLYRVRVVYWLLGLIICYVIASGLILQLFCQPSNSNYQRLSSTIPLEPKLKAESFISEDEDLLEPAESLYYWQCLSMACQIYLLFIVIILTFYNWSLGLMLSIALVMPLITAQPVRHMIMTNEFMNLRVLVKPVFLLLWLALLAIYCCPISLPYVEDIRGFVSVLFNLNSNVSYQRVSSELYDEIRRTGLTRNGRDFDNVFNYNEVAEKCVEELTSLHFTHPVLSVLLSPVNKIYRFIMLTLARMLDSKVYLAVYRVVQRHRCGGGDTLLEYLMFGFIPVIYISLLVTFVLPLKG